MQVKCDIGKTLLHKLPIYNEYMCLFWVSALFDMILIFVLKNEIKSLLHGFDHSITFYLTCTFPTFLRVRTHRNAMIALRSDIIGAERRNILSLRSLQL